MLQPGLRNAKSGVKVATPLLKPRARTAFTYQKLKYCTTLRYQKKPKSFTEAKCETNLLPFLIPKIISFVT